MRDGRLSAATCRKRGHAEMAAMAVGSARGAGAGALQGAATVQAADAVQAVRVPYAADAAPSSSDGRATVRRRTALAQSLQPSLAEPGRSRLPSAATLGSSLSSPQQAGPAAGPIAAESTGSASAPTSPRAALMPLNWPAEDRSASGVLEYRLPAIPMDLDDFWVAVVRFAQRLLPPVAAAVGQAAACGVAICLGALPAWQEHQEATAQGHRRRAAALALPPSAVDPPAAVRGLLLGLQGARGDDWQARLALVMVAGSSLMAVGAFLGPLLAGGLSSRLAALSRPTLYLANGLIGVSGGGTAILAMLSAGRAQVLLHRQAAARQPAYSSARAQVTGAAAELVLERLRWRRAVGLGSGLAYAVQGITAPLNIALETPASLVALLVGAGLVACASYRRQRHLDVDPMLAERRLELLEVGALEDALAPLQARLALVRAYKAKRRDRHPYGRYDLEVLRAYGGGWLQGLRRKVGRPVGAVDRRRLSALLNKLGAATDPMLVALLRRAGLPLGATDLSALGASALEDLEDQLLGNYKEHLRRQGREMADMLAVLGTAPEPLPHSMAPRRSAVAPLQPA